MADIRRLDGSTLDTTKPARNEGIAAMLDDLVEKNDAGRLSAIVTVYITHECSHRVDWQLPDQDFGYPWGLALRGALMDALHQMGKAVIELPDKPKPDMPDGA